MRLTSQRKSTTFLNLWLAIVPSNSKCIFVFFSIQDLQEDINPKVNFCLGKVNEFYKKTNEFSETLARFDEVLLLKASKLSLDELKNVVETKTNWIEVKQFEQKYNDKFEDFIDDLYNINSKIDHVYDKIQESLKQ